MRFARFLTVALMSAAILAGCTDTSAGWTYAPAPSLTPPPSGAASPEASGPAASGNPDVVQISALGVKYEQTTVTAPADTPFQVSFENKDAGVPHNVSLHLGDVNGAELFKGEVFPGVATRVYNVPALDAGSYAFVCTVHPTMTGTLTVE
jgi:plastocyanin